MAPKTRVGGLRSASSHDIQEEHQTALPDRKQGSYQFRSKAAAFVLSLRRRRTSRGPDGELIEEAPRSKMDNALDWIRFEDHYFETKDPEIAQTIRAKDGFGVGLQFWELADEKEAHDKAEEQELLRRLAENPDVAARVLKQAEIADIAPPQR